MPEHPNIAPRVTLAPASVLSSLAITISHVIPSQPPANRRHRDEDPRSGIRPRPFKSSFD